MMISTGNDVEDVKNWEKPLREILGAQILKDGGFSRPFHP